MPIKRTKYQSEKSLKEFYTSNEWKGAFKIRSKKMLDIIDAINEIFIETNLIATTSHQRICIGVKEEIPLNWIIIISNNCLDEYHFEYKVPNENSPWDNAWMTGTAKNLQEAIKYLLTSMDKSGAWKGNRELVKLSKTYGV